MTRHGMGGGEGRPPIVQYWHREEIPAEVTELIATFRDRNPDLRHLLFDEARAEEFIAEHFSEREVAAFRACAVPAMQADYFRYCAVLALGGVYSDADFRCLRPLWPLIEEIDNGALARGRRGQVLNGFFVFKNPGHSLLRLVLEVATANIEQRREKTVWAVTGPLILAALVALRELESAEAVRQRISNENIKRLTLSTLRAVGDHERIVEAFEGVRVMPPEIAAKWFEGPVSPLRYKQGESHWVNWQKRGASIFRPD